MNRLNQPMGVFAAVLFVCSASGLLSAQEVPSVDEIVKKTNHVAYYQGKDGRAGASMVITDGQGRTRSRQFTILRRNGETGAPDTEQKFYVYFRRPADVNKMVFMVWKHVGKDDDRWLYLPALDLVKRISSTDKRTSFVGSDFFYEDVSGRGIDEDEHELVSTTNTYYQLRNTPKDPDSVEFSYYDMWIHKETFIPVKIEYYDRNGEKYRVYEALEVKDIQGFKTVTKSRMSNLVGKSNTVMEDTDVKYNVGLPEDIFTERYLRKAPREYLR